MNLKPHVVTDGAKAPAVDPIEAQRRQTTGALMLDVREPYEWADGHVPGALLLPMGEVPVRLDEIARDREVLLICRSGNRSGSVQHLLHAHGYENVTNVAGGLTAWVRAGLPVER